MIAKAIEPQRRSVTRRVRVTLISPVILAAVLAGGTALACAQSRQAPPPKSPQESSSSKKQGQPAPPPQDDHNLDAYNAEKDIEVGTFYMHKGDADAAIPRFEEAARLRPNYGKPRLLLAQAYEKKHDPEMALKYYKEYLQVYPHAPDAKKIRKQIEKLEGP